MDWVGFNDRTVTVGYRTYTSLHPLPSHIQTYYNQLAYLLKRMYTQIQSRIWIINISINMCKITWITKKNACWSVIHIGSWIAMRMLSWNSSVQTPYYFSTGFRHLVLKHKAPYVEGYGSVGIRIGSWKALRKLIGFYHFIGMLHTK